jgi:hypothetical protein
MTEIKINRNPRDYTAEEVTAYEAYLAAVAEHNIVCARRGATTREKMDAAYAQMKAFSRFGEIAGYPIAETRSPEDIRTIEQLKLQVGKLTEAARSAMSMLAGVDALDVFTTIAAGVDLADFNAASVLLADASVILRAAVKEADAA